MKTEHMVMMTGKKYRELRSKVTNNETPEFNMGTDGKPVIVKVTDIYLDTDPEFTRHPEQYAKIQDDKQVQVMVEYEES